MHAYRKFEILVFKIILGSFGTLVSKWPVTRKQLAVERNSVKLGTLGGSCSTIDLLVFNVISGSFRAIVSKWPVTRKGLAVEHFNEVDS